MADRMKPEDLALAIMEEYTHIRRSHRKRSPLPELSRAEFDALLALHRLAEEGDGPVRPKDLGAVMHISPPTVNEHLNALVGRGLVSRSPSPGDGRSVFLTVTEEGFAQLERASNTYLDAFKELVAYMGEDEAHRLFELLHKAQSFLYDIWPTAPRKEA